MSTFEEMSNKDFVKEYVPFKELKNAGFFAKGIKFNDYDAITERFLKYYGTTKRQYILNQPTFDLQLHPDFVTGKMPSTVDKDGNLNSNGFKLSF